MNHRPFIHNYKSSLRPSRRWYFPALLGLWMGLLGLSSCAVTEHLGPGQTLLHSDPSFVKVALPESDSLSPRLPFEATSPDSLRVLGSPTISSALYSAVRTKANRRMVLPKTYLHLYNLGISMQLPLDSMAPMTWYGDTLNGRLINDLRVINAGKYKTIATIKYFEERLVPNRHYIDSLGAFLQNTAGETPKLIDSTQIQADLRNLRTTYFSEGFFYTRDTFIVEPLAANYHQRKAKVKFLIQEGKGAIIGAYEVNDSTAPPLMRELLKADSANAKLLRGALYREDDIGAERSRIVNLMRSNGYYTFNPSLIRFVVDTLPDSSRYNFRGLQPLNPKLDSTHTFPIVIRLKLDPASSQVFVRNVTFLIEPANFDFEQDRMVEILRTDFINDSLRAAWDITHRIFSDQNRIIFQGYPRVFKKLNLNFLEQLITFQRGEEYSIEAERATLKSLQALGVFKYVLIKHNVIGDSLDIRIETQLLQKYQLKAGVEGFSENNPLVSQNLPGIAIQLGLRDLMVFKGAERLDFSATGSASYLRFGEQDSIRAYLEGSAQLRFSVPRFLVPFVGKIVRDNLQRYTPTTSFSVEGSREDSQAYTRNSVTLDWNYNWIHQTKDPRFSAQSSVSPYVISFVTSRLGNEFLTSLREIDDPNLVNFLALDFVPRFSSWGRYQFSFSNYQTSKRKPTFFVQPVLEMGGNTPFLIDLLLHAGAGLNVIDTVRVFGTEDLNVKDSRLGNVLYGQYFKGSLEGRINVPLRGRTTFVWQGIIGAAAPWNFAPNVPLNSRFFAGGTNGMRAWQSNTLGPGTFRPALDDTTRATFGNLLTIGGEFQLQSSAEFRINVYKFIELAAFTDVGNVWFLPGSEVNFVGTGNAKLDPRTLFQLGWGLGLGVRLDFDFFIFRVDVAQQIYAPDIQDFVVKSFPKDLGGSRYQINFGIGYPF